MEGGERNTHNLEEQRIKMVEGKVKEEEVRHERLLGISRLN